MNTPEQQTGPYNTAGPGSIILSAVAAAIMVAATAMFLPPLGPEGEPGICFSLSGIRIPPFIGIAINTVLIAFAVVLAFSFNKKHSFVRSTEGVLPVAMTVILASNPVNTSYLGAPVVMLIANLVCLDIMMKAYHSDNATMSMFAVATYLSVGSMLQYSFLPLIVIYPVMGVMGKAFRFKETVAYIMGLVAPYWVALGLGVISLSDFRVPQFLASIPNADGTYLLLVFISLATLALVGVMMTLNNAMLVYAGNMRVRTFCNMINLLAVCCGVCMLADFDNFGAYASSFCFAVSVQIANFFAVRRIPYSGVWFWSLLSVFMLYFFVMVVDTML